MNRLHHSHIYYAPDDGTLGGLIQSSMSEVLGAQQPLAMPSGLTEVDQSLELQLSTLVGIQQDTYDTLNKLLDNSIAFEKNEEKRESDRKASKKEEQSLQSAASDLIGGPDTLDSLLDGMGSFSSGKGSDGEKGGKEVAPMEKPTINDLLALPADSNMGYLLLYWKLDEILECFKGGDGKKDKKDSGGGFDMGGLLGGIGDGVKSLVMLAAGMVVFAAALHLFAMLGPAEWAGALLGLASFALFVVGAVAVAKALDKEKKDLEGFAKSVLLLTAGLAAFALTFFLIDHIFSIPAIIKGLVMTALFIPFVLTMAGVALLVNSNEKNFEDFAKGTLIMIASLVLFAAAFYIIDEFLPYSKMVKGTIVAIAMSGFIIGMGFAAKLADGQKNSFIQMAVATVIMIASIVLFTYAIEKLDEMSWESLGTGMLKIAAMTALMVALGAVGYLAAPLLPGLLLLGIAAGAMSLGTIAFAKAIKELSEITPEMISTSRNALVEMESMIIDNLIPLMDAIGVKAMLRMVAFGKGLTSTSEGFKSFAEMIKVVAEVGDTTILTPAFKALDRMMLFLYNPAATKVGEQWTGNAGVVQVMDNMSGWVMVRLALFGAALKPFSSGMLDFAEVIKEVANMEKDSSIIPDGRTGLTSMMEFLQYTGDVMDEMENKTIKKIKKFGIALEPFSSSMGDFASVVLQVANMTDAVGTPDSPGPGIKGLNSIIDFLKQASNIVGSVVEGTGLFGLGKSNLQKFGDATGPFASSLSDLVSAVSQLGVDGFADKADTNLTKLTSILKSDSFDGIKPKQFDDFADSLEAISKGIKEFVGDDDYDPLEILSSLADSLAKVANLTFNSNLAPIADLLSSIDKAESLAKGFSQVESALSQDGAMAAKEIGASFYKPESGTTIRIGTDNLIQNISNILDQWYLNGVPINPGEIEEKPQFVTQIEKVSGSRTILPATNPRYGD